MPVLFQDWVSLLRLSGEKRFAIVNSWRRAARSLRYRACACSTPDAARRFISVMPCLSSCGPRDNNPLYACLLTFVSAASAASPLCAACFVLSVAQCMRRRVHLRCGAEQLEALVVAPRVAQFLAASDAFPANPLLCHDVVCSWSPGHRAARNDAGIGIVL